MNSSGATSATASRRCAAAAESARRRSSTGRWTELGSPTFESFETVRPHRIWDGAVARAVAGERVQVALLDIAPNQSIPAHSHPNEQVGFVIEGTIRMTIGGETRECGAGDTYVIPGGLEHSAQTSAEGCVVIDTFSPPRQDWETLERLPPSPGKWPKGSS